MSKLIIYLINLGFLNIIYGCRGLISVKDLIYFIALNYVILKLGFSFIKNEKSRVVKKRLNFLKKFLFPVIALTAAQWIDIRLDFTQDQRYTQLINKRNIRITR